MKWYPADLDAEPTLRFCSWEACYLWVKLLGLMHHSPQRGFLIKQNGDPYSEHDLVLTIHGATEEKIRNCLFELESNAVYSKDRRGVIYSRKMVKGEKRAKNLLDKKIKNEDKSEINRSKNGDKPDLESPVSNGKTKENSSSGDRSVVKPEARSQKLEARPNSNIGKKTKKAFPKPEGVEQDIWDDFKILRKNKKAPITKTALNGIEREAKKIDWSLNQALEKMVVRNWQGFKSEWIINETKNGGKNEKYSRKDDIGNQARNLLDKYSDTNPN